MSENATAADAGFRVSTAHTWMASSICLRLLMQAFFCASVRERIKFGTAMADSRPINNTTIANSISVNPAEVLCLTCAAVFILLALRFEPNLPQTVVQFFRPLVWYS